MINRTESVVQGTSRINLLLVLMLGTALSVVAQPADTVLTVFEEVARFEDARAMAADPAGNLFVADAGRDVVVKLDAGGRIVATLGGSGTAEGLFDEPSDVDATNGLAILVADAGNGRIQRFSRQFHFIEALPVGDEYEPGGGQPTYLSRESDVRPPSGGRPVAVVSSNTDETFAVDAARNVVVKWDRTRRFDRLIGGPDDGPGTLVAPVALAVDEEHLYVADRGRAGVAVYDLFGGFIRMLAEGRAGDVRSVAFAGGRLWIVLPERLLVYEAGARLDRAIDVALDAPLLDVVPDGDALYLLTSTRLFRANYPF